MHDPASLQALIAWMSLPGVGERGLTAVLDYAHGARLSLVALWEQARSAPEDLARTIPLQRRAAEALERRWDALDEDAGSLAALAAEWGIDALTPDDPDYPERLRPSRRWPALFAFGALDLLREPLVAIVNSRDASRAALDLTERVADSLSRRDVALVTGANREAYQAAALAAKRHGGPAVLALDRGLVAAFPSGPGHEPVPAARVWDAALDVETQLLVSPFGLRDGWTARSGPRRDALVFGLAAAVLAVSVRPGGHMDRECRRLAKAGTPLFVLDPAPGAPECAAEPRLDLPPERRLAPGDADAVAAAIARALPLEPAGGAQPEARWQREVRHFLIAAARALRGSPGRALVWPARGDLAEAARRTPLAAALERGEGSAPVDLALVEPPTLARLAELSARLRPDGVLMAPVPGAWLTGPQYAGRRQALLSQGQLLAVVHLPPGPGGREADAVLVYRRSAHPSPVRALHPEGPVRTGHDLRRYLRRALSILLE